MMSIFTPLLVLGVLSSQALSVQALHASERRKDESKGVYLEKTERFRKLYKPVFDAGTEHKLTTELASVEDEDDAKEFWDLAENLKIFCNKCTQRFMDANEAFRWLASDPGNRTKFDQNMQAYEYGGIRAENNIRLDEFGMPKNVFDFLDLDGDRLLNGVELMTILGVKMHFDKFEENKSAKSKTYFLMRPPKPGSEDMFQQCWSTSAEEDGKRPGFTCSEAFDNYGSNSAKCRQQSFHMDFMKPYMNMAGYNGLASKTYSKIQGDLEHAALAGEKFEESEAIESWKNIRAMPEFLQTMTDKLLHVDQKDAIALLKGYASKVAAGGSKEIPFEPLQENGMTEGLFKIADVDSSGGLNYEELFAILETTVHVLAVSSYGEVHYKSHAWAEDKEMGETSSVLKHKFNDLYNGLLADI